MRTKTQRFLSVSLAIALVLAMVPFGLLPQSTARAETAVFINELHYDNTGADAGEAVEIAGPAGTDLSGWSVALYNGNGGAQYDTIALSGSLPDLDNGYGTLAFLRAGIQNGSPDGLALLDAGSSVVQFLCYEGSFTAADGPAAGMTCVDIGVSEPSDTPLDFSLQLAGSGFVYEDFSWSGPIANTFNAVNTGQSFASSGTPVFINELHYDNAGADAGEAVEIAGPAGTDLSSWSVVLYNGNGGAQYDTIALSGSLPDLDNGYGTLAFLRAGIQNGSPDGLALVDAGSSVVQFLCYEGSFTAADGPAAGMTCVDIGVSEPSDTPLDFSLQLAGSGFVYEDFSWSGPIANTFNAVNTGQSFGGIVNAPVLAECGDILRAAEGFAFTQSVNASDADGTVVDIAINSISPSDPGTITLSDLVPAGEVGGTATATVNVSELTPAGDYDVEIIATNDDAEPQTGTCTLSVDVADVLTIGEVQGVVEDTDNGFTHNSPYVGEFVTIQGVIYQKTLARTSSGGSSYGFHIQNTADTADGDSNTSDGIFVFMSRFTDLIGGYVPEVGDEVVIQGRVSEFFNLTELSSARGLVVVRSEVDLDAEVPAFEADPPSDLDEAGRYWERREGTRAQVAADSVVLNGRDVFAGTADGEVWVAHPDSEIAQRTEPYTNRSFRDAHPLDDIPELDFDNGNGYRIIMGSIGIKAAMEDNTVLIAPARTFDTLTNSPVGGVYFSFSKYQIMVEQQLELDNGLDPALNAPPEEFDRTAEYSVVTFNVENLYDYRDDPYDGCDFEGNPGCPGVSPPFDYVPASEEAYFTRVNEIAEQIVFDLHNPDIVMTQEVEDQDMCAYLEGVFTCYLEDNADGRPDPLQDLAAAIAALGGPDYDSAYDRDGADDRGIVSAFLFRADRVELLPAYPEHPVFGDDPQVEYRADGLAYNTDVQNPKVLNAVLPDDVDRSTGTDGDNVFTRPSQVGLFRVWRIEMGASVFTDLYLLDNHFSSGPDRRVGQRTEQALYNAAIVDALETVFGQQRVVVGGDLNVYPRPDDPFAPPNTSDQLAPLYNQGLVNLYNLLVDEVPASAYGYVFQGQAQTLDQLFTSNLLLAELTQTRVAHINADFPSDYVGDGPRGTSDHDPNLGAFLTLPTLERLEELVKYFKSTGDITGKNTAVILIRHLYQAGMGLEMGNTALYRAQLQAFINQTAGFTPQFVSEGASMVLIQEAELLLSMLP